MMRYDINLINELCQEIGLPARLNDPERRVEIDLGQGAVLCFQNDDKEDDCLIGFLDTPWHTHDNLMFYGGRGYYTELDYLDLVTALKDGRVLVCEQVVKERVVDRWLIHREFNDEFEHMEEGEQIVVRRATKLGGGSA
jgi:hypothetical protein